MICALGFTATLALLLLEGGQEAEGNQASRQGSTPRTEESFTSAFRLDTLRDMDEDGIEEVLVGCPYVSTTREGTGVIFVLSGKTAEPILKVLPPEGVFRFALAVTALPDVDKDGVQDFAAAGGRSPEPGKEPVVIAFSGKNGTVLWTQALVEGGGRIVVLDAIGDRDGDKLADLVVGMPSSDPELRRPGVVQVLSGGTGKTLQVIRPGENTVDFGRSVVEVPDVNDDGVRDLVIVARWLMDYSERGYYARLRSRRYWATIYCGQHGVDLGRPAGTEDEQVCHVWSLDDAGAIALKVPGSSRPGAPKPGTVDRLRASWGEGESPSGGLLCQRPTDPAVRWFILGGGNGGMCEIGDINKDGVSDIAVGYPDRTVAGAFDVFSGKEGKPLISLLAWDVGLTKISNFGKGICPVGDFDGDEVPDLCVSSETEGTREVSPPSRLYWFSVGRRKLVRFLHVEGETARIVDLDTK